MKKVTFGEQFVWEPIDEYTSSAVDGSADVACVINDILSDSSRLKELNYKDHGTIDMYYCAAQLFSLRWVSTSTSATIYTMMNTKPIYSGT